MEFEIMDNIRLIAKISEMLEDITDLEGMHDLSRGDYQGILEAKAIQIIKLIKE